MTESQEVQEILTRKTGDCPINWELLYPKRHHDVHPEPGSRDNPDEDTVNGLVKFMQFKGRYILTPVKSGLMVIDQKRAHERILYEQNLIILRSHAGVVEQTLFPETIELNASDFVIFTEIKEEVNRLGFDIREFGKKFDCHPWHSRDCQKFRS